MADTARYQADGDKRGAAWARRAYPSETGGDVGKLNGALQGPARRVALAGAAILILLVAA
jgi:hypothetical protein